MSKYQIGMSQNFQQELSMRNKSQISVKFVRNVLKKGSRSLSSAPFVNLFPFKNSIWEDMLKKFMKGKTLSMFYLWKKNTQKSDLTDWSHFHISWRKRSIQSAIFVTRLLKKNDTLISKRFMMQSRHSCVPINCDKGFKRSLHHKRRMTFQYATCFIMFSDINCSFE